MAIQYQLNKPYPVPVGLSENRRCAQMLLRLYCGSVSELTSVCQYMYHYQEALPVYAPLAEAYQGICIAEMQHMTLLGGCIKQMGMRPKYRYFSESESPVNWSVRNVRYCSTVGDMLLADIQNEESTVKQYQQALRRTNNTQIKMLLERILEDEELHVQIFTDLYNHYY